VSGVRQWLGIPFAANAGGANRWKAPQPAPRLNGTFRAKQFGATCFQDLNQGNEEFLVIVGQNTPLQESEDCLSLNIWAPPTSRPQKTAVLIWIYGGGFEFGSSNISTYNGETFVKNNDDITVVTFNYRMNIFSAPSAPQLAGGVGNFDLLDRDAAINWVHANIAAFGGDPNRITIFGESAGAVSADAFAFAHPVSTLVKGIILESGTALLGTTNATNTSTPNSEWNIVADAVGCGTTNDAAQLACMQAVPGKTLEETVIAKNLSFAAVPDGITLFSDSAMRLEQGNFLKVPTLLGNNANEGDIFAIIDQLIATNTTNENVTLTLSEEITQGEFNCPASLSAAGRAKAGVHTFRYRYEAVFPDISPRPDLRAYHSSEIPIVFGTFNASGSPAAPTANEIKLSSFVQSAWVHFARNPAAGLRAAPFNWPTYNPNAATLGELGGTANPTGVHFTSPAQFDANCTAILAGEA